MFALPRDNSTTYIKRVIGLPGDRIQMKEGLLHINGKAVARERLPDYTGGQACGRSDKTVKHWRETLSKGASDTNAPVVYNNVFTTTTPKRTVPPGKFSRGGEQPPN